MARRTSTSSSRAPLSSNCHDHQKRTASQRGGLEILRSSRKAEPLAAPLPAGLEEAEALRLRSQRPSAPWFAFSAPPDPAAWRAPGGRGGRSAEHAPEASDGVEDAAGQSPRNFLGGPRKLLGSECGSCSAFSSTGGLEGLWEVSIGQCLLLSEQQLAQLADCSKQNFGCQGGLTDYAFSY